MRGLAINGEMGFVWFHASYNKLPSPPLLRLPAAYYQIWILVSLINFNWVWCLLGQLLISCVSLALCISTQLTPLKPLAFQGIQVAEPAR